MVTSPTLKTVEMDKLSMLAPELALREMALMLACLSRERVFLDTYIAPLLASVQGKDRMSPDVSVVRIAPMPWRYLCGPQARRRRYTTIHAGAR